MATKSTKSIATGALSPGCLAMTPTSTGENRLLGPIRACRSVRVSSSSKRCRCLARAAPASGGCASLTWRARTSRWPASPKGTPTGWRSSPSWASRRGGTPLPPRCVGGRPGCPASGAHRHRLATDGFEALVLWRPRDRRGARDCGGGRRAAALPRRSPTRPGREVPGSRWAWRGPRATDCCSTTSTSTRTRHRRA